MSIYDKSSLVLIPSGTKTGKVYSQKPVSGDGDFTFTRSSAATRVNADGFIEKETSNLLLQSNTFDTTWLDITLTKTSGQSGYDGSNDAWELECNAASSRLYQTSLSVSGVQTYSVYAKAGTLDYMGLIVAGAGAYAYFDIANGQLGATNVGTIDHKIESIGGGWYRCSIAYTGTTTAVRIYPAQSDNDTAQTSGSIYIQDAQLEQGLVARDYIETTSSAVEGGITDNVPRLDYTDSSCPALLLEPQRTNLVDYSEWFGSSNWTKQTGITITDNTTEVLSPEGKYNAAKIVSADATKGFFDNTKSSTASSVRSIYLRGAVGGETALLKDISGFGGILSITLTTDWVRYELATSNTGDTYRGLFVDNISVGTIYAYGAQWEEGSYATSYIPTYGSSVTRIGEDCRISGADNYIGQTQGTLFLEYDALDSDGGNVWFNVAGETSFTDWIFVGQSGSQVRAYFKAGNSVINDYQASQNDGINKVAMVYSSNLIKVFVDGSLVDTHTGSWSFSQTMGKIEINAGGTPVIGQAAVNQALLFPTAITDQEAIDLTTI